jgi:flagellar hook-associated protein 2
VAFFTNVVERNKTNEKNGTNAEFTINGLETQRQSNTFNINGVTITLKGKFEFDTPPVNLSITTDTDKIFDTVVGFINEYNELLDKVNGKLTEEHHRDFKPMTDEQKEAMSEKEIERWEEKARSGLLRRDSTLSSGMDRLRVNIYSPVTSNNENSTIRQLTDLGISTTSNYMDRGKLEINESKLRAAIEKDPEGVFQLFAADGPTNADKGIARRMRDSLDSTMRSVSERAGGSYGKLQNHQFTLGRNLADIDSRVSNFERRLQQVEDRYWKQFTAMEKAMQTANAQADNMYSMLTGGQ